MSRLGEPGLIGGLGQGGFISLAAAAASSAPPDSAGNKLWLQGNLGIYDATSGGSAVTSDAAAVKRWEDQSGSGLHFTEATDAPLRRNNGVNGAVSLRFATKKLERTHAASSVLNTLQDGSYTFCWALTFNSLNGSWFSKVWAGDSRILFLESKGIARFNSFASTDWGTGAYSAPTTATPYVITYTFSRSAANTGTETWRINGKTVAIHTGSVPAVDTTQPWVIGTGYFGASPFAFPFTGDIALVLAYNSAKTGADLTAIEDYARTYCGLAAFPTYPEPNLIFGVGDSITLGVGSTGGLNWLNQLRTLLAREIPVANMGVSGTGIADIASERAYYYDHAGTVKSRVIFTVWAGTNDIAGGVSAATAYGNLQAVCAALQATGAKVVTFTMLKRLGLSGPQETERVAYNAAILAGFSGATLAVDAVGDVAADAAFSDTSNPTYSDGIHPSNIGYGVIAGYAQTAITPLLLP